MRFSPSGLLLALGLGACQEYNLGGSDKVPAPEDTALPAGSDPSTPDTPGSPTGTSPSAPVPDLVVDPLLIDFGGWPVDCPTPRVAVTLTNVGAAELQVSRITLDNNSAGVFRTAYADPVTLSPGAQHQVLVDFTPAELIGYPTANLHIQSNDPDRPTVDVLLDGEGAELARWTDRWTQAGTGPTDVLFVLDNSGSMDGELDNLANTFDVFIQAFVDLGLDYQIGVITTDMDNPAQAGRLLGPDRLITAALPDPVASFRAAVDQGSSGSGSERGLEAAHVALTEPLLSGHNAGLVRKGSTLSVIVVTDENDDSEDYISPASFSAFLDAYQGDPERTSFSAVAGPKSGFLPCISFFSGISAEPAPRYWTVVQNTGGIHSPICDMDMADILAELSVVASGVRTTFPLSLTPVDPNGITARIEGFSVPRSAVNGVSYDALTNSLVFAGDWVPLPGNAVEATYEVADACP